MDDTAFEILGIEPTRDGRVIRAAFLRLARIYHPDRFADLSDDVREEAERRMKAATIAYETLREAIQKMDALRPAIDDEELQERARAYREMAEAKRVEQERDRTRWRRWEEIEFQARSRADLEAEIAATIANGVGKPPSTMHRRPPKRDAQPEREENGSLLSQRLDAARRGETAPLVPRQSTAG